MSSIIRSLFGKKEERQLVTIDDYISQVNQFIYNGLAYTAGAPVIQQTLAGDLAEEIPNNFDAFAKLSKSHDVIFSCMAVRALVFSGVRLQWQKLGTDGQPSKLFGTKELGVFEHPWEGGTTQDLLVRMIQDVDLCGNSYWVREGDELLRLRPDWVQIILEPRTLSGVVGPTSQIIGWTKVGYAYWHGGIHEGKEPVLLGLRDVAHFAPHPDPEATFRGMSWISPLISEIQNDKLMQRHKRKYLENGATASMVISLDKAVSYENFQKFKAALQKEHSGPHNAYKMMFLGAGADAKVVGADMQQLDFKKLQGHAEPLALDTPIPTPNGWTTMGALQVGDQVIGSDGRPANVVGKSPVHVGRETYRVSFKDGTSIVADGSHLWSVRDRDTARSEDKIVTTEQMIETGLRSTSGGSRWSVPATPVLDLKPVTVPIDPYVLGAWLGDGQTAGAAICGADDDLAFIDSEINARGYTTSRWSTADDKVSVIGIPGGLLAALKATGVLGNKHIPEVYLRASFAQRLDLLRGLMDTDGTVSGHHNKGACSFSSKWESLAKQVAELARSLGYRVAVYRSEDKRSRTGEHWTVTFRVRQDCIPFLLPRKVQRCTDAGEPTVSARRQIVAIERVDSVPVQCIAVDTDDHLFLAGEGLVPTHNTRIAAAAGVPPIIVGLSEGLSSATYSNYGQARRRFADGTMHPLWQNVAGSLSVLLDGPPSRFRPGPGGERELLPPRLWYDARDHPFLREDEKDLAEIRQMEAQTIGRLIDAGFVPESVIEGVIAQDWSVMEHSGLYSVQLQPPLPEGVQPAQGLPPSSQPQKPSAKEPAKKDSADGSDPSPDQAQKAKPANSGKSASNKE